MMMQAGRNEGEIKIASGMRQASTTVRLGYLDYRSADLKAAKLSCARNCSLRKETLKLFTNVFCLLFFSLKRLSTADAADKINKTVAPVFSGTPRPCPTRFLTMTSTAVDTSTGN